MTENRAAWSSRPKDSFIKFNINADFKEILYRLAAAYNINISEYMRQRAYDFVEDYENIDDRPYDNEP